MKRISIDSQMARIDVTTINAKLTVRSPKRSFRVKNTPPKMNANTKQPTFTADTQKIRSQRGLDPSGVFSKKTEQKGKADVNSDTRQNVALGEEALALMPHENQNVMVNRAKRNMATDEVQVDMPDVREPRETPQIIPGTTDIEWDRGDLDVKWSNANWMPEVQVEPYSVEVELEQKASVKVTVHDEAEYFHRTSGRRLDRAT